MPGQTVNQVYFNRRMAALVGLGFAAGLPSAYRLLGSSLQAWLGKYDYDIRQIGMLSLVTLPIAFNFVWAPLLDRYPPPVFSHLGRRRGWLMTIQLILILAIIFIAMTGPTGKGDSLLPLVYAAMFTAFLVASHDVVADAYRTDVLGKAELGAGAAVFVNGYRIGMLAAGGGALLLSDYMQWRWVYMVLAGLMGVGILVTCLAPKVPGQSLKPNTLTAAVVDPIVDFVQRKKWTALAILVFVVLFKLPDSMARAMTIPLLQTHLKFELQEIALVREWMGLAILIIGALAGGAITTKVGVKPSLWIFGTLQALSNVGFLLLTVYDKHLGLLTVVVCVENFCAGLVTAGFMAFLMGQCNRRYSATQYALFTSLMFGADSILGAGTGFLVQGMGFTSFFWITILASIPSMVMLAFIGPITGMRERGFDDP